MRKKLMLLTLAISLFIPFAGRKTLAEAQNSLNFVFRDSSKRTFHSNALSVDLYDRYNIIGLPSVVLVLTETLKNPDYLKQSEILDGLDAENLELLFVIACPAEIEKHGYHTDLMTAKKLMPKDAKFKVLVLDGKGRILRQSPSVLSKNKIRNTVLKWRNQRDGKIGL